MSTLKVLQFSLAVSIDCNDNSWHGKGHLEYSLEVNVCHFKGQFSNLKIQVK